MAQSITPTENKSQVRTEEILKKRAEILAQRRKLLKAEQKIPVLTFYIGSDRYGTKVSQLVSIRNTKTISAIPGASKRVCGIMAIQGDVYTVLHLSQDSTKANTKDISSGYALLLVSKDRSKFALYVDSLDSIIHVREDEISGNRNLVQKEGESFLFLDMKSILENQINRENRS